MLARLDDQAFAASSRENTSILNFLRKLRAGSSQPDAIAPVQTRAFAYLCNHYERTRYWRDARCRGGDPVELKIHSELRMRDIAHRRAQRGEAISNKSDGRFQIYPLDFAALKSVYARVDPDNSSVRSAIATALLEEGAVEPASREGVSSASISPQIAEQWIASDQPVPLFEGTLLILQARHDPAAQAAVNSLLGDLRNGWMVRVICDNDMQNSFEKPIARLISALAVSPSHARDPHLRIQLMMSTDPTTSEPIHKAILTCLNSQNDELALFAAQVLPKSQATCKSVAARYAKLQDASLGIRYLLTLQSKSDDVSKTREYFTSLLTTQLPSDDANYINKYLDKTNPAYLTP